MPNALADLFAQAVAAPRQNLQFAGQPASSNVQQAPVNWPAFLAEQMRNIPPIIGSGPASQGAVPPRMGGQLGKLSDSADTRINQVMATTPGPQSSIARYLLPMPDQIPYDPTYEWNRQHR